MTPPPRFQLSAVFDEWNLASCNPNNYHETTVSATSDVIGGVMTPPYEWRIFPMNVYETKTMADRLSGNTYPGRGIVLGVTPDDLRSGCPDPEAASSI